ncbi:UDP-N-acetylmuramate dehydrogenase [Marinobacter pelagius]|uniref:UDP-N-acetylenolpyruvoylglucosamine reductase n=1 Tax=Marinobacter pelagius TaxID=379482 RepID=A0A1I4TBQ2_9GAMM|nr:UDP-N-acetylmuramate dehydrogenase [Marinobacter pelagius]SFM74043.1 UDP-N-acetylmuramate dehydrogenase [Marinobacter pelagius]
MKNRVSVQEQVDLQAFNTLQVPATARYFLELRDSELLEDALTWARERGLDTLFIGGGSNLVFAGDFPGLVIHMAIQGRHWEQIEGDEATLVLGAGENWHDAVLYATKSGYRGIENLALIPGTAGAAPVQNIGAYGVELCDTLVSVTAFDRETGKWLRLANDQCGFGYRESLFKRKSGRYVITEIRLRLSRSKPLQLGYRDLEEYLASLPDREPDALSVAEAVMAIRRRKLPDPRQLPNAGSFFKNPVVTEADYGRLKELYPDIPAYPQAQGVKVAAAWLIDQCGWKGYRDSRVGVHNRQALVLINHAGGTGRNILELADRIRESVRKRFGVILEMEPGVVGGAGLSPIV